MNEIVLFSLLTLGNNELHCDRKEKNSLPYGFRDVNLCFMATLTTIINSPGITMSPKDETIRGLIFDPNEKIRFLPEKVAETFPNLVYYEATGCSLKEISQINLENLTKLETLDLSRNQIIKISNNTFGNLTSLKDLDLSKNLQFVSLMFVVSC